jgi:hypothetical protein
VNRARFVAGGSLANIPLSHSSLQRFNHSTLIARICSKHISIKASRTSVRCVYPKHLCLIELIDEAILIQLVRLTGCACHKGINPCLHSDAVSAIVAFIVRQSTVCRSLDLERGLLCCPSPARNVRVPAKTPPFRTL